MKFTTHRCYKRFNSDLFLKDLAFSSVFSRIFFIKDTEIAWNLWFTEFTRICNNHAPLRSYKTKDRKNPWITDDTRNFLEKGDAGTS